MRVDPPGLVDIDSPLQLAVIVGSARQGRIGGVVATWFLNRLAGVEMKIDLIDLAELDLPTDLRADGRVGEFAGRIGAADAFVMITPEYNHGYPAALKLAIDSVRAEWAAKPVGFVSYGGQSGGLRAVEQLRQVCAELHLVSIRDTVSLPHVRHQFDAAGRLRHPEAAEQAATRLLQRLSWWGRALRSARETDPYPA
jgi:NAD(P)H-dependent FMN reductase